MGVPTGGDLGSARGSITIDTSQLAAAAATARAFATNVERMFGGIPPAANRAQIGLNGLAGAVRGLAGAFGLSFGVAGIVQLGKMTVASVQAATAYDRQALAARSLAGSQSKLNDLLEAYGKATGGAVDDATALADVTNLQAIGFAKNADEMERFVRAARGISIAKGTPLADTTNELALGIANQSTRRFDQLGLSISEVNKRITELRDNNRSLTREEAFQEAVLQVATEKYGDLTTAAIAQATGLEKLRKSWGNLGLAIGQVSEGPMNAFAAAASLLIDVQIARLKAWMNEIDVYIELLRSIGMAGPWLTSGERAFVGSAGARDVARHARSTGGPAPEPEGAREIRLDWAKGVTELNDRLHDEINDAERDYGRQRADTIRTYNTGILREQRDFAIGRQRAEEDHLEAISDIHEDAARREKRLADDLARSIADAQADSGERIAEAREDTTERLIELEEDFQKNRERAAEDHRDKILSAAGRLDAVTLLEERKRWARENKDAKDAHKEQRDDLQKQLAKRIEDENKALAKSINQQQEAAQRQLEDARAADELRIKDMEADFAKRKAQEDADRAIRLADQATDHATQLAEMDTAQGERKAQLKRHAAEERAQLDIEAQEALLALGVRNAAWQKALDAKEEALEKMWDKFMLHIGESFGVQGPKLGPKEPAPTWPSLANPPSFAAGGLVRSSGWARVHAGEFVMPQPMVAAASGMSGRSTAFNGDIHVNIAGSTNMGESEMYRVARMAFVDALEEVGGS